MEKYIPPQFYNQAEAQAFNTLMETVEPVDTGSFASNIFINAMIAGGLQWIWSMVPSQQIIILIPFLAIDLPANALAVFNFKL